MKHGRSQIPVSPFIEPTEGGLCCEKFPKVAQKKSLLFAQVKGKLASRGNNVYVLDFKRFCPVRKSRCKGMFPRLQDLTGFFFFSLPFFFSASSSSRCRDGVTEDVWAKYAYRFPSECVSWRSFKIYHMGKVCFLPASHTFKFVCGGIL